METVSDTIDENGKRHLVVRYMDEEKTKIETKRTKRQQNQPSANDNHCFSEVPETIQKTKEHVMKCEGQMLPLPTT